MRPPNPPISPSEISKIESGHRRLTQEWRERLASPLKCDPEDLLPDSDPLTLSAQIERLWQKLDPAQQVVLLGRLAGPPEGRALVVREPEPEAGPAAAGEAGEPGEPEAAAGGRTEKLLEIVVEDDGHYTATIYCRPRRGPGKSGG